MTGIFISYRRQEASGHAGRLRDHLRIRFGDLVFQDVDDIPAGEIFENVLDRALKACQVALIVMGRDWAACTDAAGRRRLDDPQDWVRIETRQLLSRDIRVIPVLVGGATMPRAEELPDELRSLAKRQYRELRDTSWDADVRALIQRLEDVLKAPAPPPAAAEDTANRSRGTLWSILAGVGVVLAGTWFVLRGTGPESGPVSATPDIVAPVSGSKPTPPTAPADPTIAAAQALGLPGTTWRMEDFSGMERPAGAATTYEIKLRDGMVYLEAVEGDPSKDRMVVRQIQDRAVTFLPKPADGKKFEFMYVFELAPGGSKLDQCQTVRAADFAALGPCQWRYHRVKPGTGQAAASATATPQACGDAGLIGAIDPACIAAAKAAGLIGAWRAGDGGAVYRFGIEGNAVRLSSPALKNEAPWRLAIRSVKDGTVTFAWAGFLGKADNFDAQTWYEYDLAADGARLVKCRAVTALSARHETSQCTDVPPFLVRERTG